MQTILATFDDKQAAQQAVDQLIASGFSRTNVHLESGSTGTTASSTSTSTSTGGYSAGSSDTRGTGYTGTEDEGFLSRVGHFFSHLFESDDTSSADNYSEAVRRGSAVVAVDAASDDEVAKAERLMKSLGSIDIDERAEQWRSKGWKGFDPKASMSEDDATFQRESVPVVQEELAVGKRTVNVGSLRVVKRKSEMPVTEIVKLREEHAKVTRKPVDRPATEADFDTFKEGTLEVRETAEEPVVGKTARVVEEVSVGKEVTEREQEVSDTVRRTDVDVERDPGTRTASDRSMNPDRSMNEDVDTSVDPGLDRDGSAGRTTRNRRI